DDVVRTTGEKQIALAVQKTQILGTKPAGVVQLTTLLLVFASHLATAYINQSRFVRGQHVAAVITDLHFDGAGELADRGQLAGHLRIVTCRSRPVVVWCEHSNGGTGFRQS